MEVGSCHSNKNECAKEVLVFCRKTWIKEPEDHGGRLPELHEVPDVSVQFLYICKCLESTFSPEASVPSSLLLPSRVNCNLVRLPQYRISPQLCTSNHRGFCSVRRCSDIQQASAAVTVV